MKYGSLRIASEWIEGKLEPALRALAEEAQDLAWSLYQWEFYLTSILRTPAENDALYVARGFHPGTHTDGVHVRGRGIDIRTRDVDPEAVEGLAGFLNERYVYDPDRPHLLVALMEDGITAGSGRHLHLQISPNTKNRHFEETQHGEPPAQAVPGMPEAGPSDT